MSVYQYWKASVGEDANKRGRSKEKSPANQKIRVTTIRPDKIQITYAGNSQTCPVSLMQNYVETKDHPSLDSRSTVVFGPANQMRHKIGACIGKGFYGHVKLDCVNLKHFQSGEVITKLVAVKEILMKRQEQIVIDKFLYRELEVHSRCRHINIVVLFGYKEYFVEGKLEKVKMFCEFCPNGTLLQYLKKHTVGMDQARNWFRQISNAILYMHSNEICHRDLKCDNVLFDENWNVKLCDFGFAKLCVDRKGAPEDRSSTFCGTAAYVAPELIRNERYEPKAADIWSLGVLLYYMIAGKLPFGETAVQVFSTQEKVPPTFRQKFVMQRHSAHLDQLTECDALLRALLNKDAARRPTIAMVVLHTWLQSSEEDLAATSEDLAEYEFVDELADANSVSSCFVDQESQKEQEKKEEVKQSVPVEEKLFVRKDIPAFRASRVFSVAVARGNEVPPSGFLARLTGVRATELVAPVQPVTETVCLAPSPAEKQRSYFFSMWRRLAQDDPIVPNTKAVAASKNEVGKSSRSGVSASAQFSRPSRVDSAVREHNSTTCYKQLSETRKSGKSRDIITNDAVNRPSPSIAPVNSNESRRSPFIHRMFNRLISFSHRASSNPENKLGDQSVKSLAD